MNPSASRVASKFLGAADYDFARKLAVGQVWELVGALRLLQGRGKPTIFITPPNGRIYPQPDYGDPKVIVKTPKVRILDVELRGSSLKRLTLRVGRANFYFGGPARKKNWTMHPPDAINLLPKVFGKLLSGEMPFSWEGLAQRLNRELGSSFGGYSAEELKDAHEDGEYLVDLPSWEGDPRATSLPKQFPELRWSHWWDYGALNQKEWFPTADKK